jgi:hypothetical protein
MLRHVAYGLLLALILTACTPGTRLRPDFEALAEQTPWRMESGIERREIVLGGGVVAYQKRNGEKVETLEMDESGHGAVLCAREIYRSSLENLELCFPDEDDWRKDFTTALDRIDKFIVENDPAPVAQRDLEADTYKTVNRIREERSSWTAAQIDKACKGASMFRSIMQQGHEKFRAHIDGLLSVPRPPVLNPCL